MTPEQLFLSKLPLIERVIASTCRRHCVFGDEADEFDAVVKLKLVDDDYAVLRKFKGKSLLKTYLMTVIANLFRDYLIKKHGKWRSSKIALTLGREAIRLEQLIYRDGLGSQQAVEILKRNAGVEQSRDELAAMAARLPVRERRQFESDAVFDNMGADGKVDERIRDRERADVARRLEMSLARSLAALPQEDRLILQLWLQGVSIAAIAKRLGSVQRRLYTRRDRALRKLAEDLESEGLSAEQVRGLLGWERLELRLGLEDKDGEDETSRIRKPMTESVQTRGM